MDDATSTISRRSILAASAAAATMGGTGTAAAAPGLADLDPIRTELVMNLVVTCSAPVKIGATSSKDGVRENIWPIVGGRCEGPMIRATVVPGGWDGPVVRPDGVMVVDALYRLLTDDGVTLVVHNKGLAYPLEPGKKWPKFRLTPEFIAPVGRYDWLNRSIFLSTLVVDVPSAMALAKGPHENDRLIQVHRVF